MQLSWRLLTPRGELSTVGMRGMVASDVPYATKLRSLPSLLPFGMAAEGTTGALDESWRQQYWSRCQHLLPLLPHQVPAVRRGEDSKNSDPTSSDRSTTR